MDAYPRMLRDVSDADLASLVAEPEFLQHCGALTRALVERWLAARDTIEWLQAEQRVAQCAARRPQQPPAPRMESIAAGELLLPERSGDTIAI